MTTFKGNLHAVQPWRTHDRIVDHPIQIGEYVTSNNKSAYSKFTAWVFVPQTTSDVPSIMISLSNASGRTFCRLGSGDYDILLEHLLACKASLAEAVQTARARSYKLQAVAAAIDKLDANGELPYLLRDDQDFPEIPA